MASIIVKILWISPDLKERVFVLLWIESEVKKSADKIATEMLNNK